MAPISVVLLALLSAASLCHAHYAFVRLALNGVWQDPMRYIRYRTAPYNEPPPTTPSDDGPRSRGWISPTVTSDSAESIRCGRDNMAHAAGTEILKVKPGDTVEFVSTAYPPSVWGDREMIIWDECPEGRGACSLWFPGEDFNFEIFHPGPAILHLSKVPAGQEIERYDGSGEWVKIKTWGLEIHRELEDPRVWVPQNGWSKWPGRLIATLPKQTPAGRYLLRMDQVYYGSLTGLGLPQMYPACAHIEVESEMVGSLPKGIRIPEDMSRASPGMTSEGLHNTTGWLYPGGQLWDGEKLSEDRSPPWYFE